MIGGYFSKRKTNSPSQSRKRKKLVKDVYYRNRFSYLLSIGCNARLDFATLVLQAQNKEKGQEMMCDNNTLLKHGTRPVDLGTVRIYRIDRHFEFLKRMKSASASLTDVLVY
jgi:hypothetical protein